mmetsp:Transcript_118164/g.381388  ORF Transcript_118164/g.381388 Transcript_118164/m.381388 type:complete len:300 (-) Transcript_118164:544-1443(-)
MPSSCTAAARSPRTHVPTRATGRAAGGRTSSARAGRLTPTASTSFAPTTLADATAPAAPPRWTPRTAGGTAAASRASRFMTRSPPSSRCWTTSASTRSMRAWAPPWAACRASAPRPSSPSASGSSSPSPRAPRASRAASPSATRSARPSCPTRTGTAGTTTTARCPPRACGSPGSWGPSPTAPAWSGSSASASAGEVRRQPTASRRSSRSSGTLCSKGRWQTRTTIRTRCSGSPRPSTASTWSSRARTGSCALPRAWPRPCSRPWSSVCGTTCSSPCGSSARWPKPCALPGISRWPTTS